MGSDLPEWVKETPCHIRQNAIEDAWDAHRQALANGGEAKFKSFRKPTHAIKFNPEDFGRGTWYSNKAKGMTFKSSSPMPDECPYGTQLVKQRNRWYAIIPEVVAPELTESNAVIALDPGVRSFLTGYDGRTISEIAAGDIGRIYRLCQHLDDLISCSTKVKSRQRRRMRKAANRMRFKIRNLVDELHHKVARWLVDNYKVIFLPTFETSQMVPKKSRKIKARVSSSNDDLVALPV